MITKENQEAVLENCTKAFDLLWKATQGKETKNRAEIESMLTDSPASSMPSHHGAFRGGLMVHSMYVVAVALKLAKILLPNFNKASVAFVAMVHDLAKANSYRANYLKSGLISESKPFERCTDLIPVSDPIKTISLVFGLFPDTTDIELQAIAYHDGQYVPGNRDIAMQEHPLTLILHWADVWSARFLDNGEEKEWMSSDIIGKVDPLATVKEFFGK